MSTLSATHAANDGILVFDAFEPGKYIRLSYDTDEWIKVLFPDREGVSEWIGWTGEALLHRAEDTCYLKGNSPREFIGLDVSFVESLAYLGNHEYHKLELIDSNQVKFPFAIYDSVITIEYADGKSRDICFLDGEKVLSTYQLVDEP